MKFFASVLACLLLLPAPAWARDLNVGVIQFESTDGDIAGNLKKAEGWLNKAVAAGAELIVFPEFMPTGYRLSEDIWDSGETMHGQTVRWLKKQSAKKRVWLGTTFLEVDGEHFYDTFILTNPKGQVAGKVRKEVPPSLESYFFKGEASDHVIETELGRIGVLICYENYLSRLANKVAAANVDLLLSPFSSAEVRGGTGTQPLSGSEYAGFYAAALGIPVAAANKVGPWRSPLPGYPGLITDGEFPGTSAIARADGSIAAKLDRNADFVVAKVHLDPMAKKSDVTFTGKFIAGFFRITAAAGTSTSTPAADDIGLPSYTASEKRKSKALSIDRHKSAPSDTASSTGY